MLYVSFPFTGWMVRCFSLFGQYKQLIEDEHFPQWQHGSHTLFRSTRRAAGTEIQRLYDVYIDIYSLLLCDLIRLKPGFHYPSWRPELTARVDGWPVSITRQHGPSTRLVETRARQHGPCWLVMETGHPSTRAVNSGSGNRALVDRQASCCGRL